MTNLIQPFVLLFNSEKKARDLYEMYASQTKDEELRNLFLMIKKQEEEHMKIAQKLLQVIG